MVSAYTSCMRNMASTEMIPFKDARAFCQYLYVIIPATIILEGVCSYKLIQSGVQELMGQFNPHQERRVEQIHLEEAADESLVKIAVNIAVPVVKVAFGLGFAAYTIAETTKFINELYEQK